MAPQRGVRLQPGHARGCRTAEHELQHRPAQACNPMHAAATVRQARGSGDYRAGNEQWRPLGLTALLLFSLGLAASKDNFWSTPVQRGNKWGDATVRADAQTTLPRCDE